MKKALLISCYGWYEKRLKPIKELLENTYECEIINGDFAHSKKEYVEEKREDCTYIHVPSYKKNVSIGRLLSHFLFSEKVYELLQKNKPDLIYALVPPNSLGSYCAKYKTLHMDCTLIIDVIDMWPESMPLDKYKNTFPFVLWKRMRNNSLKKADYVFTECNLYIDSIEKYAPGRINVLHLMKSQNEEEKRLVEAAIRTITPISSRNEIVIGYLGSINYIINIPAIIDVLETLKSKYEVTVKIIGDGESRDQLLKEIANTGAKVEFFGKIYDESKKIEILAQCDAALNLMKQSVKVGLTLKSIDYFSYGLPIINNIKGDTWDWVNKEIPGINYDSNKDDILRWIDSLTSENHTEVHKKFEEHFSRVGFDKKVSSTLHNLIDG